MSYIEVEGFGQVLIFLLSSSEEQVSKGLVSTKSLIVCLIFHWKKSYNFEGKVAKIKHRYIDL